MGLYGMTKPEHRALVFFMGAESRLRIMNWRGGMPMSRVYN